MTKLGRTAALAALGAAVIIISSLAVQHASAHEPHPGLEFSIGVRGVPGCNTRASDVTCTMPVGGTFVLEVGLDALPDDIPSYRGFDLYAEYSGGLTPSQDANNDDWPGCGFPAAFTGDDFVGWGCATGLPPAGPSSWIGPIGTVTFTCSESGSITLVHSAAGKTDLVEAVTDEGEGGTPGQSIIHTEGSDTQETLTITCGQLPANTPGVVTTGTPGPAGPTPGEAHPEITGGQTPGGPTLEPTQAAIATATAQARGTATPKSSPTPGDGPDGGGDDDGNMWVWIVIIVAAVAAVGIAGGGYWWFRRAQASGGGTGGTPTSGGGAPSGGAPTSGGGGTGGTPTSDASSGGATPSG